MKILASDGTGRTPNSTQLEVIDFLNAVWDSSSVIGIGAPTGAGKSFIARAIQLANPGTLILTPNNQLVNQYCASYPDLKRCIGRTHYTDSAEQDANFALMAGGKDAVLNPSSFWHKALRAKPSVQPTCIILDEADGAYGMIQQFSDRTIVISKSQVDLSLVEILKQKLESALLNHTKKPESKRNLSLYKSAQYWYRTISEDSHLYAHHITSEKVNVRTVYRLVVQSLLIQRSVQRRFFGSAKVILMSATLMPTDLKAITGRDLGLQFKSFSSPIAVNRRSIYIGKLLPIAPTYGSDFNSYTTGVREVIDSMKYLGAGMVHTTYSESKIWSDLWSDSIGHTSDNKNAALTRFRRNGGVLLGSGLSAGLDLPGDSCRFNIIPKLHYPNLSDPLVVKRKALIDGESWYKLETLRHTMQAVGRSTRNPDDWSITAILDPRFPRLLNDCWRSAPNWFKEAVTSTLPDIRGL